MDIMRPREPRQVPVLSGAKHFVHNEHRWRDLDAATSSNSSDAVLDDDFHNGPTGDHCQESRHLPEEVRHDHLASVVAHPNAAICHVPGDLDLFSITHRDSQFANVVVASHTLGLGQDPQQRQPGFVIRNFENRHLQTLLLAAHGHRQIRSYDVHMPDERSQVGCWRRDPRSPRLPWERSVARAVGCGASQSHQ